MTGCLGSIVLNLGLFEIQSNLHSKIFSGCMHLLQADTARSIRCCMQLLGQNVHTGPYTIHARVHLSYMAVSGGGYMCTCCMHAQFLRVVLLTVQVSMPVRNTMKKEDKLQVKSLTAIDIQ